MWSMQKNVKCVRSVHMHVYACYHNLGHSGTLILPEPKGLELKAKMAWKGPIPFPSHLPQV